MKKKILDETKIKLVKVYSEELDTLQAVRYYQ